MPARDGPQPLGGRPGSAARLSPSPHRGARIAGQPPPAAASLPAAGSASRAGRGTLLAALC